MEKPKSSEEELGMRSQYLQPGEELATKKLDFRSADHVMLVLEEGSAEQREQLRQHTNISQEILNTAIGFAQLRRRTIAGMRQLVQERRGAGVQLTLEEQELGCFIEQIEPQVRNAVRIARDKGYHTVFSGFHGALRQEIGVRESIPNVWNIPESLKEVMKAYGVEIWSQEHSFGFTCSRFLNLKELEEIWGAIVHTLPSVDV